MPKTENAGQAAPRGEYLAVADFLRVASISLVAWYHFWQQSWLNPNFSIGGKTVNLLGLVSSGYMMVDVLLVLSGFLLTVPYARARTEHRPSPSTADFYAKRFWRIFPSYFFAIAVVFLAFALPEHSYPSAGRAIGDLLMHLSFTHNLSTYSYLSTPLPGVLWTLAVEVQFYLIFPLLMKLYRRSPAAVCAGLTLAALAVRAWILLRVEDTTVLVNQLPCMLDLYACGMLAATAYVSASAKRPGRAFAWLTPALALLCFLLLLQIIYVQPYGDYVEARRQQLIWRLPVGLLTGYILLFGCLISDKPGRIVGNPATRWLSGISYNFYIWHQFLALRLKKWHLPPYVSEAPNVASEAPWQQQYSILCFAAGIVLAAQLTGLLEKPLASYGRKRMKARRGKAPIHQS